MYEKVEKLLQEVTEKKELLDSYRPLPKELLHNLNEWFTIELTYTSNALEGNTLTKSETALVVEKGITIGGKTMREHLEAINHVYALDFIYQLASLTKDAITLQDIRSIHSLILKGIDDTNAGKIRTILVRIKGVDVALPEPFLLDELLEEYIKWLHTTTQHPVLVALDAHLKFVTIHPFVDGNGRTARLIMNLLLLQTGYPVLSIKPEERLAYINALAKAQTTGDASDYYELLITCLERSLDTYIEFAQKSMY